MNVQRINTGNQTPVTDQPKEQRPRLTKRGKLVTAVGAVILAGLSVLGAKSVAEHAAANGVEFTQEQLADMPQHDVVVRPNEGVNEVVMSVDPGAANDPEGLYDLTNYVLPQGTVHDSHGNPELAANQVVHVPVVEKLGGQPDK